MLFAAAQGPALEPAPGATYACKDPHTGWVAVPKLRSSVQSSHWTRRLPAMLVLLLKLGAAGLICGCHGGHTANGNVAQAAVLLAVTVVQLAYVFLARPWNSCLVQAAMSAGALLETAMAGCFVAATASTPSSLSVSNALVTLVVLGVVSYGCLLLGLMVAPLVRRMTHRKQERLAAVVHAAVRQDAQYLQRKYADRCVFAHLLVCVVGPLLCLS